MYLEQFGLNKPPFSITPDTSMFYEGSARGATLQTLVYAVLNSEGIIKVVGEVGSGKTTLCRMLSDKVHENVDWVYLAHPVLEPEQMLRAVADELGVDSDSCLHKVSLVKAICQSLIERYSQGRRVVALVEEAQAIPLASLEELRLLSNLETNEHKLLQIVLFGQSELDDKLKDRNIRQFADRITYHFQLKPMDSFDMKDYLNFRMRKAGYKGPDIFNQESARLICMYSAGLVRRANILADKTLQIACSKGRYNVNKKDIKLAALNNQMIKENAFTNIRKKLFANA